jgi:hypothetical protein
MPTIALKSASRQFLLKVSATYRALSSYIIYFGIIHEKDSLIQCQANASILPHILAFAILGRRERQLEGLHCLPGNIALPPHTVALGQKTEPKRQEKSEWKKKMTSSQIIGLCPDLVNQRIDGVLWPIERAQIVGVPTLISSSFTKSGHEPLWNWPNLGESTSIAAFLPFFPVQNKPSNHQINSSFAKSEPDPFYLTNDSYQG